MKLKIYDSDIQNSVRTDKVAKISVKLKNGTISLSRGLIEMMNLKAGDRIAFAQDETHPADWYIFKSETGMLTRGEDTDKMPFVIGAKVLALAIAKSIPLDHDDAALIVIKVGPVILIDDKTKFYPLITKGAVVK